MIGAAALLVTCIVGNPSYRPASSQDIPGGVMNSLVASPRTQYFTDVTSVWSALFLDEDFL